MRKFFGVSKNFSTSAQSFLNNVKIYLISVTTNSDVITDVKLSFFPRIKLVLSRIRSCQDSGEKIISFDHFANTSYNAKWKATIYYCLPSCSWFFVTVFVVVHCDPCVLVHMKKTDIWYDSPLNRSFEKTLKVNGSPFFLSLLSPSLSQTKRILNASFLRLLAFFYNKCLLNFVN